jgi:hypothetical protein
MLILRHLKRIKLSLLTGQIITFICLMMTNNTYASSAEIARNAQLKVTPKPCVTLHKGQKCYLEVTFNWQHPHVSNYCLVNVTTNKLMKCWHQQAKGKFSFDFQSQLSNDFVLRKEGSTKDLAKARIPVAWVYKSYKRPKSSWRLF